MPLTIKHHTLTYPAIVVTFHFNLPLNAHMHIYTQTYVVYLTGNGSARSQEEVFQISC